MKSVVLVFPGSNCDRDVQVALAQSSGRRPAMVWHRESELPPTDLVVVPGGFSYGDYLRCGAMAARSPIMRAVIAAAKRGVPVLGICNGFQILTECGLLPGALMRNAGLRFVCRDVDLRVETSETLYTRRYNAGQVIRIPIAHAEGNYFADTETIRRIEDDNRVVFRYSTADGAITPEANPNGSLGNIAGILSENRRILGMMPHPERLADPLLGGTDGRPFFESLTEALAA